ncbi:hypothetical protein LINGRAHAP2_LOCUS10845 [Linum grandiflorum]
MMMTSSSFKVPSLVQLKHLMKEVSSSCPSIFPKATLTSLQRSSSSPR